MTGDRVQIPAYFDLWAQGDRFGVIIAYTNNSIRVRMDKCGRAYWIDRAVIDNYGQWL